MIFKDNCQKYYDKGLPVIPLMAGKKKPILLSWSGYCEAMPDQPTIDKWLEDQPHGNIGLPLGPQSNMCALDIDHPDKEIMNLILSAVPKSPWARVGAKGVVVMYRWNPRINGGRKRAIRAKNGDTIFEILAKGSQVVLPPSIHPDTLMPYTSNCELVDVADELPMLPDDAIEKIQKVLEGRIEFKGVNDERLSRVKFVSAGGRDNAMTQVTGKTAKDIRLGELNVIEALEYIDAWCDLHVEKVAGDDIDKGKAHAQLLQFLKDDINIRKHTIAPDWDKGLTDEQKDEWGLNFDAEQEQWSYTQLIEYCQQSFETTMEKSPERLECIDFVMKKIAQSPDLTPNDSSRVLNYVKDHSGEKLTKADYNKMIKKMGAGDMEGVSHTEIAEQAIKDYERLNGDLRYYGGEFWNWKGDHWSIIPNVVLKAMIAKDYGHLPCALRSNDHNGILAVMSNLISSNLRKSDMKGVNFANGVVDKDLKLHKHHLDHGMTSVLPVSYDPSDAGKCPRFLALLESYWGQDSDYEQKLLCFQECLAVTLFGEAPRFQRVFLLYGIGDSGKSQLLDIISSIIPEEAKTAISPEDFDKEYNRAALNGKLLNIAGELHEKRKISGKHFKEITDGTEITGRSPYKDIARFKSTAAQWFSSNHLPRSDDTSSGFYRRWVIFHFTHAVPDSKKVRDIGISIAKEEMAGILAWAMEGYARLEANNNYTLPESHNQLVGDMMSHNSPIMSFLNNSKKLERTSSGSISLEDMHRLYYTESMATGQSVESIQKFAMQISMMDRKTRGFDIERIDDEVHYIGIKEFTG